MGERTWVTPRALCWAPPRRPRLTAQPGVPLGPSAQRLVCAAKQALGNAALGAHASGLLIQSSAINTLLELVCLDNSCSTPSSTQQMPQEVAGCGC